MDIDAYQSPFYCELCFAYEEDECYCEKIIGIDAETGFQIIEITDEEWDYI